MELNKAKRIIVTNSNGIKVLDWNDSGVNKLFFKNIGDRVYIKQTRFRSKKRSYTTTPNDSVEIDEEANW